MAHRFLQAMHRTPRGVMALGTSTLLIACAAYQPSAGKPKSLADYLPASWAVSTHPFEWATGDESVPAETSIPVLVAMPVPAPPAADPRAAIGHEVLVVFIEGDGNAWNTRSTPSADPTPRDPLALKLALSHAENARIAYVARPCQFEADGWSGCMPWRWTHGRYSFSNVAALSAAIDEVKRDREEVILVGYSGGGVMAALLAAMRGDVRGFITIAANLDTELWTRHHGVSALSDSMNPAEQADLAMIPQVHLVGGEDSIVPEDILASYLQKLGIAARGRRVLLPDYDHACCWVDNWRQLAPQAMQLLNEQIGVSAETLP